VADRELLELAAKVAGYVVHQYDETKGSCWIWNGERYHWWCPLTDDGDRYRLARTLGINIDFAECYAWKRLPSGNLIQEFWGGDTGIDEAHAIVRAAVAAAIGKEKE